MGCSALETSPESQPDFRKSEKKIMMYVLFFLIMIKIITPMYFILAVATNMLNISHSLEVTFL